jgi:mRNA-degrading endonuclease toxin of MazEF toxin-antitoxin module
VRPVLVVSADSGNRTSESVVVAALTTTIPEKNYPMNVYLPEGDPLDKAGVVLCRSLYTLPKADLKGYRADLSAEQMVAVDRGLISALALPKVR